MLRSRDRLANSSDVLVVRTGRPALKTQFLGRACKGGRPKPQEDGHERRHDCSTCLRDGTPATAVAPLTPGRPRHTLLQRHFPRFCVAMRILSPSPRAFPPGRPPTIALHPGSHLAPLGATGRDSEDWNTLPDPPAEDSMETQGATPLDELRRPHPEQTRVDAEAAALLRATASYLLRLLPDRVKPSPPPPPLPQRQLQVREESALGS